MRSSSDSKTNTNPELNRLRKALNKHITKRSHALQVLEDEQNRLSKAKENEAHCLQAQQELQILAQAVQARSHKQISQIASRCLSAVFSDPYKLKIDFVRLRGKTEAKLVYLKDGSEVDPLRTSGGVLDISALSLRLAHLLLSTPPMRRFLILDEPMKGVAARNLLKAAALIETLSKEMGIQFLLITHNEALEVGKVIQL